MAAAAADHVPEDLIEDIFSRVPLKSLARFKSASKKWYSLLSQDGQFANSHLNQSNKNHRVVLINNFGNVFQSLNIDTNASCKFKFPILHEIGIRLMGSANGLICVAAPYDTGCYIWNPFTGECKKVSAIPNSNFMLYGFGYDSCSDDYKIAAHCGGRFQIFSLKTNSWKIFEYSFYTIDVAFYFNGALHWCLREKIAAFDLAKEVFSYIELPDEMKVKVYMDRPEPVTLMEYYQGLLCISEGKSIWVMKNYGDPKSWVKLTTFVEKPTPLGISKLGEVVYQLKDGSGFVKFDIQGTMSDHDKSQIRNDMFRPLSVFTESLISPRCFDSEKTTTRPRKRRKTSATA